MDTNICIIGAGVVGLAIAAELSKKHDNVFVIEKHKKFGQETSSRNSEVIHSGIYYPQGSLKARLCVEGRQMLYDFCKAHDIMYRKCGKVIIAADNKEAEQLPGILEQARKNGVGTAREITADELRELEPYVKAVKALYFPESGIVDSHGLMKQLETQALLNGAELAYQTEVVGINSLDEGYRINVQDAQGSFSFSAKSIINSAGLGSWEIAKMLGISDPSCQLHFWKGEYWAVGNGKNKFVNRLIYPVPETNTTGLGIHATVDLNRGVKLGPNAVYIGNKSLEYSVDKSKKMDFFHSAVRFLPFLGPEDLHPDQSGIRPKLQKPGDPVRDFIITEERERGYPRFINLIGIESPGLTSCLAIAKYVDNLLQGAA